MGDERGHQRPQYLQVSHVNKYVIFACFSVITTRFVWLRALIEISQVLPHFWEALCWTMVTTYIYVWMSGHLRFFLKEYKNLYM